MYLKLTKTDWDSIRFVVTCRQKDYQYLEKEKTSIFIYGYPFNYSTNSWISASDVYNLYLRGELSFIDKIEGVYTIVILDKIKKKCFIIVDRYGIYTLFYSRNDDYIILSDVISDIATHMSSVRLNKQSILEYINFGFKLGNKTHIEYVYEFEASRIYEISQELKITEKPYWELQGDLEKAKITQEEFLTIFNAHIAAAMNLSEKICLPLTGGLDTRTILSACIPEKERLHCYTHGLKNASDVKLAQTICNQLRIRHSFYELSEGWIKTIPSMAKSNAEMLNGLVPTINLMHVEESYTKESAEGDLLISGMMGNEIWRCLFGSKVANCTNVDDVSMVITKQIMTDMNPNVICVYVDYNDREVINLLRESVKTELLSGKGNTDPVALSETFVFRNYCSNWASNTTKAMGKHFRVFAALLHRDLLQDIRLMSLAEKVNGSIQKYTIISNNSYLANLPLEVINTGGTVTGKWSHRCKSYIRSFIVLSKVAIILISRRFLKGSCAMHIPTYTDYPMWLRSYHRDFILEVISYEKMATKELFKKDELENAVSAFLNGDASLTPFIIRLISLELWLKTITEGKEVTIGNQRM